MKGTEVISESDKWRGTQQHQCPQPILLTGHVSQRLLSM